MQLTIVFQRKFDIVLGAGLVGFEQCQGNRISLGEAPCIIGMQMVSTVVTWKQLRRVARVPQDRVEIDYRIEFTAAEDPLVNPLPLGFPLGSIKSDYQPLEV